MLGESHALVIDFPMLKDEIIALNNSDGGFKIQAEVYHKLDFEIRELELKGSPVNDDYMHQLKQKRSQLKDNLYQILQQHKK
ncbi:YdcH family protein [Motilimonas pumila]|uniref:DUF465 domain-containing protein n=1 Tax=Motilimonas pumila TaxID=2303987 RepID=A0A418YDA1_9GAMM|nr:YdcH family protein [Motilimonas pumila]RJG42503.1 DUF465 domain-containing protein [Motilimonas pumila]